MLALTFFNKNTNDFLNCDISVIFNCIHRNFGLQCTLPVLTDKTVQQYDLHFLSYDVLFEWYVSRALCVLSPVLLNNDSAFSGSRYSYTANVDQLITFPTVCASLFLSLSLTTATATTTSFHFCIFSNAFFSCQHSCIFSRKCNFHFFYLPLDLPFNDFSIYLNTCISYFCFSKELISLSHNV